MATPILQAVKVERLVQDTLQLVRVPSPTGDARAMADCYEQMLREVGCTVERYEFYPNNPTLVATFAGDEPGKTLIFNGHMDTVTLAHEEPEVRGERIYGRGTCDMKGDLACIIEALRVLRETGTRLKGNVLVIANSLHESPGGRGEDLIALLERVPVQADAVVVMEGATRDCTIAQLGSATFRIVVRREGETSHQLYTPPGTPHPIQIAAEIVRRLGQMNEVLEREYIEDIGYASYFIGSIHSGQFYNQFPKEAEIIGVRRYNPTTSYEEVERELRDALNRIAAQHQVEIDLELEKVRDGYRIDPSSDIVQSLVRSVAEVRNHPLPLVGKKLVTDAGIFVNGLSVPTICHGADASTAHSDVEYVEIRELELTAKVYLELIMDYMNAG